MDTHPEVLQLAFFYWLHLLATVVWLGGAAGLVIVAHFEPKLNLLTWEKRLRPWSGASAAVLLITGFVQMGADPLYAGLLRLENAWSIALMVKHVLFGLMLALSIWAQWGALPKLDRLQLLQAVDQPDYQQLRSRLRTAARVEIALGVCVLLVTAYMTAL